MGLLGIVILGQVVGVRSRTGRLFFKGQSMSLNKIGLVVLVVLVIAILVSVFSGNLKDILGGFSSSVTYPEVGS